MRGNFVAKTGYWLGKYPVTQREWQTVLAYNPSWFAKDNVGRDKVEGMNTGNFPVEQVSWSDCNKFLDKLNGRAGTEKVFGRPGKFVLPTEDEWEYACRGGKGNGRMYYFGDAPNGKFANCNGENPFGTEEKGPNMERTTSVGAYENLAPHPWGLCDMHGNVWQWCDDWYGSQHSKRNLRGGAWTNDARDCRAATRFGEDPFIGLRNIGFRVCFRTN